MLRLQNLSYIHPNKDLLFQDLHLNIQPHQKLALVGNNGVGKSTLLKIMAGVLPASSGVVIAESTPYYIPQHFGQYNELTVAQALHVDGKLNALQKILAGEATEGDLTLLDDDWTIEERCQRALEHWGLNDVQLSQTMNMLSGGQKTKVFLTGILIHQPHIVLMDEPSNHLDVDGRRLLYDFVQSTSSALVVVSHDRMLLNLLPAVVEMTKQGLVVYGGNYEFFREQKSIETEALNEDVRSREKALRKARETERETAEKRQRLDARGKKKQEKAGLPTISMNTLKNNAEKSTARLKDVHAEKIGAISKELSDLRKELPDLDKMRFSFEDSVLHQGKVLLNAQDINVAFSGVLLWPQPTSLEIRSGERIVIKGDNGSGKTTLIKILLGKLEPAVGNIERAQNSFVYIDQDYSLIDDSLQVYEQAERFNTAALQEHEIKIWLTRFLFMKGDWDKSCRALSGGEKMRLLLCCLTISNKAPDIIVLDEPTNNLDIQNVEILTTAINSYQGTLIVVSHDEYFLDEIKVQRAIEL